MLLRLVRGGIRSFDRAKHNDPARETEAAIMIDQIGGKRGRGIQPGIRQRHHDVRRVRNYSAPNRTRIPGR